GEHPNYAAIIAAIRQAVSEAQSLEVYAVSLVRPGKVAKTSSGKVQRFAVREAYMSDQLEPIADSRGAFSAGPPATAAAEPPKGKQRTAEDLEVWICGELAN